MNLPSLYTSTLIDPLVDNKSLDLDYSDILGSFDSDQLFVEFSKLYTSTDSIYFAVELNETVLATASFIKWLFEKLYNFLKGIIQIVVNLLKKIFSIDNKISAFSSMKQNKTISLISNNSSTNKSEWDLEFGNIEVSHMCTHSEFKSFLGLFTQCTNTILSGMSTINNQLDHLDAQQPENPIWLTTSVMQNFESLGITISSSLSVTYKSAFSKYENSSLKSLGYTVDSTSTLLKEMRNTTSPAFTKFANMKHLLDESLSKIKKNRDRLISTDSTSKTVVTEGVTRIQKHIQLCVSLFAAMRQVHTTFNYRLNTLSTKVNTSLDYVKK